MQKIKDKEDRMAKFKKNKVQTKGLDKASFEPIESESPLLKEWVPTSDK